MKKEPEMIGCGSAFEYMSLNGDLCGEGQVLTDYDESTLLAKLNELGAEGWEVICFQSQMIYLKRKCLTARERGDAKIIKDIFSKYIAEGGGTDGEPTH